MKVGVLANLDKHGATESIIKMGEIFEKEGITAYLPENMRFKGYLNLTEEEIYSNADIIITVGGDGTVIRFAKKASDYGKPVLGVNAGRLGYLCTLEQNRLNLLSNLKNGDYDIEERMVLKVTVSDRGRLLGEYIAINDMVISSGFISRLIDINVSLGEGDIHYRADGLIAASPTGSTAYSLSAGGPIVEPTAENIIITPICSHSLDAKPIIIGAKSEVNLTAYSRKHSDIYLLIDGRKVAQIKPHTVITVEKSPTPIKLINITKGSFYKVLSEKFSGVSQ